jgi:hypothetical protein
MGAAVVPTSTRSRMAPLEALKVSVPSRTTALKAPRRVAIGLGLVLRGAVSASGRER